MPMGDGPNDAGLSRHHLIEACEASLRRLRTDHIDLYQVHEWDGQTPLEETLDALDALVRAGKVRYIGCSNYAGWQLMKALGDLRPPAASQRFVSQQIYYSLQAREAEYELVPAALDQGLGILVWSPLAGGLLSGKYRRDAAARRRARHLTDWDEPPVHDEDQLYDIVDALVEIGEAPRRLGRAGRARLAARPARRHLGDRRRAHGGAARRQPRRRRPRAAHADERARLDEVSAPPLLYPYWHQAKTAADRLGAADLTPARAAPRLTAGNRRSGTSRSPRRRAARPASRVRRGRPSGPSWAG